MIKFEDYLNRFFDLKIQFNLAEAAIGGWAHSQEALDHYAAEELEGLRKIFQESSEKAGKDPKQAWVFSDEDRVREYTQHVRTSAPQRIDDVRARLQQYSYILHVSIFESFMKSVHREILRARPDLLRPNRNIELGRLVAEGQDSILKAEIDREVQGLDRESTQKKADYFRKRLRINWFDGTIVPLLEGVIAVRNEILHEDPERPVEDHEAWLLSITTVAVPFATVMGAHALYPAVCALPEHTTEESTRHFVVPNAEPPEAPN